MKIINPSILKETKSIRWIIIYKNQILCYIINILSNRRQNMAAMALKQKVINYIDTLDDEQTLSVIMFIESMPRKNEPLQNSKTPEQRAKAKQALDEIFAMGRPAKHEISLNGRKEAAQAIRRKYESLN